MLETKVNESFKQTILTSCKYALDSGQLYGTIKKRFNSNYA